MGDVVLFTGGPPKPRPKTLRCHPASKIVQFLVVSADGEHGHLFTHWERRLIAEANRAPRLLPRQEAYLLDLTSEFFDRQYEFSTQHKRNMGGQNHER